MHIRCPRVDFDDFRHTIDMESVDEGDIFTINEPVLIHDKSQVRALLTQTFGERIGAQREFTQVIYLDRKHRLRAVEHHRDGDLDSCSINPYEIVQNARKISHAMRTDVSHIISAHNHPDGLASPSHEDLVSHRVAAEYLRQHDLELADACILGMGTVEDFDKLVKCMDEQSEVLCSRSTRIVHGNNAMRKGRTAIRKFNAIRKQQLNAVSDVRFHCLSQTENFVNGI